MPKPFVGFSSGNKYLAKKWDEYQYKVHKRKLENAKSRVQIREPKQFPHLILRLKQVQKEEERQAEISRGNQILLHKMTNIMQNKGRVDNWNDYAPRSLNSFAREKEQESIASENFGIARRLEAIRPHYRPEEWDENYHKHVYYKELWGKDTKPLRGVHGSPRGAMSEMDYDDYGSDYEGRSTRQGTDLARSDGQNSATFSRYNKVPPIKGGGKEVIVEQDVKLLFKAIKGLVKPEDAISRALVKRSQSHRMAVKAKFEEMYDLDLLEELKGSTSSSLHPLLECLLAERGVADAEAVNSAIYDNDIEELVVILCSRPRAALVNMKEAYVKTFEATVEEDIEDKIVDKECQILLKNLLKGSKSSGEVDDNLADQDALDLYEAGPGPERFQEDGIFLTLLYTRSLPQLKAMLTSYKMVAGGEPLLKTMEKDGCSKDYLKAVETMSMMMNSGPTYFADIIHENLQSGNKEMIMALLQRSEIDMPAVRKAYRRKYGAELVDAVLRKGGDSGPLLAQVATKGSTSQAKSRGRADSPGSNKTAQSKKQNQQPPPKQQAPAKKTTGTIKPASNFNPEIDAKKIREAIEGWGTDEAPLIEILAGRSNAQRQEIKKAYTLRYNEDLKGALQKELSGDFEEVVVGLLLPPVEYDAYSLHEAMDGLGTNEAVVIGIVCSRTDKELKAISDMYKKKYGSDLVADIKSDTSGEFRKLLIQLIRVQRDQSGTVNPQLAVKDAKRFYNKGDTVLDLSSPTFMEIMCKRNPAQLQAMFAEYKQLANQDITDGIREAMAGDDEAAYIGLVQVLNDPIDFYARRIYDAVKGLGTKDTQLIRILVARSEIDLADIKARYKQLYKKNLEDTIESECSGDYKNMLLAIVADKKDDTSKQKKQGGASQKPATTRAPAKKPKPQKEENTQAQKLKDTGANGNGNGKGNTDAKAANGAENGASSKSGGAERLHEIVTGSTGETDDERKEELIELLTSKNLEERLSMAEDYEKKYQTSAVTALTDYLGGDFEDLVVALFTPPMELAVQALHKSTDGFGTDERTLDEILVTHSAKDLNKISELYKKEHQKDLVDVVEGETSGYYQKVLLHLLGKSSPEILEETKKTAQQYAELMDKPEEAEEDEILKAIIIVLTQKSEAEAKKTFDTYKQISGTTFEDLVEKHAHGDLQDLLLTMVQCHKDIAAYFANKLYLSLHGLNKDEDVVTRIIVMRSEVDLPKIKAAYKNMNTTKKTLEEDLDSGFTGAYKSLLLALVGGKKK